MLRGGLGVRMSKRNGNGGGCGEEGEVKQMLKLPTAVFYVV